MKRELNACPNCGSRDVIAAKILRPYRTRLGPSLPHRWWMECRECSFCGPTKWTRGAAARAWNRMKRVFFK